jgi:hypothetical protein
MRALSVKPPWAYYIIYGVPFGVSVDIGDGRTRVENSGKVVLKNIENRDWPLPVRFKLPQRIQVHVGKKEDAIEGVLEMFHKIGLPYGSALMSYSKKLPRGAIIGEIDIIDCVTESKSPWFVGKYGFVLANPVAYAKPIPYKGKLGFFEVELPEVQKG